MIKNTYLAELVGTCVFLTVILRGGNAGVGGPFAVIAGLLAAILLEGGGRVSGAHFNPAVSVMMHLQGDRSTGDPSDLVGYVVAQVLGGALALKLSELLDTKLD